MWTIVHDPSVAGEFYVLGREEVPNVDAEALSELRKVQDRDVPHPAFNAAHVAAIDATGIRCGLLRQSSAGAEVADARAEAFEDRVARCLRHPPMVRIRGLIGHGRSSTRTHAL